MKRELASAIGIRPMESGDRGFVLDSFRRNIMSDATVLDLLGFGCVSDHVAQLERLVRGGIGSFAVASLADSPDCIEGWAASCNGRLVFAYVRPAFRRWGIAGALVDVLLPEVTPMPLVYWTRDAEAIHREHGYPLTWDWETFREINRKPRRAA